MRYIDEGFSKLNKCRSEIVENYCPSDVEQELPDLDINTYKFEDGDTQKGCRGITCEECWDKEYIKNEEKR